MREKCDMQLQDFYEMLGGSYQEIKERLQSDELILRLMFKFLNDKSYENLCRAVEEEAYEEAFRAAHTLKGVCQNLSFGELGASSGELTELLRNRETVPVDRERCMELFGQVCADYRVVIEAITTLKGQKD